MPEGIKKLGFAILAIVIVVELLKFYGVIGGKSLFVAIAANGNQQHYYAPAGFVPQQQTVRTKQQHRCDDGFAMVNGKCTVTNQYDGHPLYDVKAKCNPGDPITIQVPHPTNPNITRTVTQTCEVGVPKHLRNR